MRLNNVLLLPVVLVLAACQNLDLSGQQRFERHSMSNLKTDPAGEETVFIFEAKTSAQYPANSPSAESVRMRWAEEWLAFRSLCPDGFEVLSKRAFTTDDYNPNRYALRYELGCLMPPAAN